MRECVKYKKYSYVPCGSSMNRCKPSYCVPNSSRNWTRCNMANWRDKRYKTNKKFCKKLKCKMSKKRNKTKNTVNAKILHKKMPYIWRFLKPHTQKLIIELANKPIKEININRHIFQSKKGTKYTRKEKRLRKIYKNI